MNLVRKEQNMDSENQKNRMFNKCIIFGLSNNVELATIISQKINIQLGAVDKRVFLDSEILIKPVHTVRGRHVFVIQSTHFPVNDSLMELLIFIDALKRSSAQTITVIAPYYAYARQDRKCNSHEPITAKLIASLLEAAGMTRFITFDLHSPQIEGFFNVPVDNLSALPTLCRYLVQNGIREALTIVSPDKGGVVRARQLAESLNLPLAIIDKRRINNNVAKVMNVLGDVKNRNCLLIDDIIDSAGTIVEGVKILMANGAKHIYVAATHAIFSGPAVERLSQCEAIKSIIVTDTITLPPEKKLTKLRLVSIGDFLGDVVEAIVMSNPIGHVYNQHTKLLPGK